MALYTEKTQEEALRPLANYNGDNSYVKGQIYSMTNGGNLYDSARNYNSYKQALEDAKANDNDNSFTGVGDFFVGRSKEKQKADLADEYLKAYSADPFQFSGSSYNDSASKIKGKDLDKGQILDGGLLGGIINPFSQTSKAAYDLYHGATTGDWNDWNNRDHWSDVGALGDVVLTAVTLGSGAGATTLGKTIAKGALTGAGYGAFGTMNELGNNTWTPEGLGNLALSTGIGAGIGGGMSGLGYGVNKLSDLAKNNRATVTESVISAPGDSTPYQEALNNLKSYAPNNYSNTPTNLPSVGGTDFARVTLDNLDDDTLKQMFKSGVLKAKGTGYNDVNNATSLLKDSKDLLSEYLKNGIPNKTTTTQSVSYPGLAKTKVGRATQGLGDYLKSGGLSNSKLGKATSRILKTKTGKIGAGVGAGLVLNKVLNGKKNQELSDEEADELYNYYYGGQ